jgi:hypothetical protein
MIRGDFFLRGSFMLPRGPEVSAATKPSAIMRCGSASATGGHDPETTRAQLHLVVAEITPYLAYLEVRGQAERVRSQSGVFVWRTPEP